MDICALCDRLAGAYYITLPCSRSGQKKVRTRTVMRTYASYGYGEGIYITGGLTTGIKVLKENNEFKANEQRHSELKRIL